ncbi:MAG: permease-like cell division protein FtsX [Gammaproteobacteria bacterium]|nr:permease-like cell division protein FtsX [Gammaproteobacteria bacterium]
MVRNKDNATDTGKRPRPNKPRGRVNAYFTHHLWVLVSSLGGLWRTPLATLMTAAVIGIALALPAGLHVLLQNVQQLSTGWEGTAQMSLFLKPAVTETQAQSLAEKLRGWEGVEEVRYISREQALAEFREVSGFGEALESLDENPLPAVLVLRPSAKATAPAQMELLLGRVRALEPVDLAQLDMEWVRRLSGIIEVGKRGVLLLAGLLGMAILLVVGNTIRLTILSRTQEIVVTKLIGATNAFIRRPFLYTGLWYGLMGAVVAWLLVAILLGLLSAPVNRLSFLYNSRFSLGGLDLQTVAVLLASGVGLGLLGSWLAVGKHLKAIEPS